MMSNTISGSMTADTAEKHVWVAFGQAGAVGSIHRTENGFGVRMLDDSDYRGVYPRLDVAMNALYSNMLPGSDRPEFKEH